MSIPCPTCENPVTIPPTRGISEPRRADGGLREKLAALQAECERLRANATHSQAEMKAFQSERLALRNENTALKQSVAAAEEQLAQLEVVRQRLEATETQLSSLDQERATDRASLAEATDGRAAAMAALDEVRAKHAAANARSSELETHLTEVRTAHAAALDEVTALQKRFAVASGEAESLRGLMDRDEASRELLSARTRLTAADEELQMRRQSATQLEMDLIKAEADRDRLDEEKAGLQRRLAEALKQAGDLSKDNLHADNAKLRELLERQNAELKTCFRELTRFRRAKLTLKIIWALSTLAAIGLGYFFVKVLPSIEWAH